MLLKGIPIAPNVVGIGVTNIVIIIAKIGLKPMLINKCIAIIPDAPNPEITSKNYCNNILIIIN
jgi:hypothetical protein